MHEKAVRAAELDVQASRLLLDKGCWSIGLSGVKALVGHSLKSALGPWPDLRRAPEYVRYWPQAD